MTKETGTLAELNVQPGDVVEHVGSGRQYKVGKWSYVYGEWFIDGSGSTLSNEEFFHLISRAPSPTKTATASAWRN